MRAEISALVASVNDLTQRNTALDGKVTAEVANSFALKAALDAAIAGSLSPQDMAALSASKASIDAVITSMVDSTQKLVDSAAVNSPAN